MEENSLNARVLQRIEVTPSLVILRVVPEQGRLPGFVPGQYGVLGLPGTAPRCAGSMPEEVPSPPDRLIKRPYSVASSSVNREYAEFFISLVTSGALSPRLLALRPGDPVYLGPQFKGTFTLDRVAGDRHCLLLATGTGLAPYVSMMRSLLECGGGRRFAVLAGARHSWDLGYRSELMMLRRLCANFTYIPVISRPEAESVAWRGATGYLQDLYSGPALQEAWGCRPSPGDTSVFLCGNPGMVTAMLERLAGDGFVEHTRRSPGQVHTEKYW